MARMRKNKSRRLKNKSLLKKIKNTSSKVLPAVESGLKVVGSTVKTVAVKSAPTVNKGISNIYGVLASGFNKGVKTFTKVSKRRNKKRHGTQKHYTDQKEK